MMTDHLLALCQDVHRLLASPLKTENDFIFLAVAGERLRRSTLVEEDVAARDTLRAYQALLESGRATVPQSFEDELASVLNELSEFAARDFDIAELGDGYNLLDSIDETLSVLVATVRAGTGDATTVERCGARATETVRRLLPGLAGLAEFAERHQAQLAADPDYPDAFAFWDELARIAPAHIATQRAFSELARKDRVLEQFRRGQHKPSEVQLDLVDAVEIAGETNKLSPKIFDRIERFSHDSPGAFADWLRSSALQISGKLDDASQLADSAMLRAFESNDFCLALRAGARKVSILYELRRQSEAQSLSDRLRESVVDEALRQAANAKDNVLLARIHLFVARFAAANADWGATRDAASRALGHASSSSRAACSARWLRALARWELRESTSILEELRQCADEASALSMDETHCRILRIEGALLLDRGLPDLACVRFGRAHALALARGHQHDRVIFRALELVAQSRIGADLSRTLKNLAEAERAAASVQEWDIAAFVAGALAVSRRTHAGITARQDLARATQYAMFAGSSRLVVQYLLQQTGWLLHDGDHAAAQVLLSVLQAQSDDLEVSLQAEVLYLAWKCALSMDDFETALRSLSELVKISSTPDRFGVELVFTLAASGRGSDALAEVKHITSVGEEDRDGLLACPAILFETDRGQALAMAHECAQPADRSANATFVAHARLVRARLRIALGDPGEAKQDLHNLLGSADVEDPLRASAELLLLLIQCVLRQGERVKSTWPCPGKPEDLAGQPLGMYHCEFCGEMQLAGAPHLEPQFPEQWEEPFPKIEWPSEPAPVTTCPSCDAPSSVTFTREKERFPYGITPHTVELTAVVDKGRCSACAFEFTDWRAEEARDSAVRAHLRAAEEE